LRVQAPPGRSIRLGEHQADVMTRPDHRAQRRRGEIRCAGERDLPRDGRARVTREGGEVMRGAVAPAALRASSSPS
jgi:hypothetical protein